jgi:probable HAF family extracellular repeat protein
VHGFAWIPGRGMLDVGTFGGDTYPNAINTKGIVVGTSYTFGNAESRPFAWTKSGGLIDLGTLGGRFGEALAVSDTGVIVGYSYTAGVVSYPHPFAWTQATGMIDLGTLGGGYGGYAVDVNNNGLVVGNNYTADGLGLQGFTWTETAGMVTTTAGTRPYSQIAKVTGRGSLLGLAYDPSGTSHATVWTPVATTTAVRPTALKGENGAPSR